ncbi:Eco57I restriction-modification methylase domain-containing protein [Urbifossiella limnaea]|uniref:site-specific DNA-methyltransferase (adenine-specific) n=1 Tax=Urbifossiella limnaea TaxID=2528023 RepID=A0A517XT87_9BACT|nr:N-6 DNA methylase [Urbifossiella limnaea]QDU20739.1 Modification methylase PaeR7I [Urbifossiella limnaea]
MAVESKPLFRPEAIRPVVESVVLMPASTQPRVKLGKWAALLSTAAADKKKETELLPDYLRDVFVELLGYTGPADGGPVYTLKREALVQVDGKYADAALGRFGAAGDTIMVAVEGKGPRDPLDRPFAGRKRSAVEQAALYALQLRADWYVVTNLKEIRLYHKGHDTAHYERFEMGTLAADEAELRRFVAILGAARVAPDTGVNHLDMLFVESKKIGRALTADYYREYRQLREQTFAALCQHNPQRPPRELLALTQKILDRVLFIAFGEDRGLLPRDTIADAYKHRDRYTRRPIWENFRGLFDAVNEGKPDLGIDQYNGGLYKPDPAVDLLTVPDAVCEGFKRLADYEYGKPGSGSATYIDVDILGHIFEQSITDLEETQTQLAAGADADAAGPSKRKREGAFYTPEFITGYIVAETLGPVLRDRFETLRAAHQLAAKRSKKAKALDDPRVFDADMLDTTARNLLVGFWRDWANGLETVRIVDPSCGSGAFLIEAFDQMFAHYREAEGYLQALGSGSNLFEPQRTILTHNLFGMDLNGAAVEIARLSCWIKTAARGKLLTALDRNIIEGNSVVAPAADVSPRDHWRATFPDVFAAGGFDVVIGNPPYVRQEWIKGDKPYLQRHYRAYDGVADLYVYFYELGLNVLRPGGRLGYIVTNKWMKAGYGEALRQLYAEAAWLETVVDLGHNKQIFPDADVFPCILTARKPDAGPAPESARVCVIPREQFRVDDLSRQIRAEGVSVPRSRFGADPWNLEPRGVADLMAKLKAVGLTLREFAGVSPLYGVKTGCNEAFVVDTPTRDRLVNEHPSSAAVLKKYLRGQDVDRWRSEWAGQWMIFARRGIDINQFPAVKRHLEAYRIQLEPKPKDWAGKEWPGRKPGAYKWYELQDPVEYWQAFGNPKLVYQVIQYHPSYALDVAGMLGNDKTFFLPTADLYLLGVLNSPAMWWHNWRALVHLKDEALSPMGYLVEQTPIPRPTADQRAAVEAAVGQLVERTRERQTGRAAVVDWLRAEFGVEKPSQKLQDPAGLDSDEFTAEVKKGRKKGLTVADVKRLRDEFEASVRPLQRLTREADALEHRISDTVNAAFGLTPAEVKLMWDTAPPRMPVQRPITG